MQKETTVSLQDIECPDVHPLFEKIPGRVEPWERV
jgi:hypothetical protein